MNIYLESVNLDEIRSAAAAGLADGVAFSHTAASADAAIALLELHKEIRLIFTDVDMPGWMDGLKLAHYVRGRWPPVIVRGRPAPCVMAARQTR